jgi:hypothetical protein
MMVLTFFYVLASRRTNITLVITFFSIDMTFFMLMSSYWTAAEGRDSIAKRTTNREYITSTFNYCVTHNVRLVLVFLADLECSRFSVRASAWRLE